MAGGEILSCFFCGGLPDKELRVSSGFVDRRREEGFFLVLWLLSDVDAGGGEPFFSEGSAVPERSLSNSLPRMALISFFIKIQLTCISFHGIQR
jgi:hypothetical protein